MNDQDILIDRQLEAFKVDSNNYEEIDNGDFDPIENEVTRICLVKDKTNNNIYIKKDFYCDDDDSIENKNDSCDSPDGIPENDDDDFDMQISQNIDGAYSHTSSMKYFKREVKHLFEVQIKGFPFLHFIGFNYKTEDSCHFIITEQMKGNTLGYLIKNNFNNVPNPNTSKMIIFYGVAFALKILHNKNIIHRDVKPDNIFLNEANEPFLGDFGYARLIHDSTKLTENVGTTIYMAQELFNEDSQTDIEPSDKIDSYSFAVTVLETLMSELFILKGNKKILCKINTEFSSEIEVDITTIREYIKNGERYYIDDKKVDSNFRELIESCWSENSIERWSMETIVEKMENEELCLPDYDKDEFFRYVNKLKKAQLMNERISSKSDTKGDFDENKKESKSDSFEEPVEPKDIKKKTESINNSKDDSDPPKKKPKSKRISAKKFKPKITPA